MIEKQKKKQIFAIKGTKDILPQEARKWQKVEGIVKKLFELYGYREIRTPILESTELFEKGTGKTSDVVIKEMYTFRDKGGRSVTLRPEYTPSVVRSIIENRLYLKTPPLKFYFIGPMFRYDKPQKGRYRQFHQIDVEVFNEEDPAIDAEIVELSDNMCKRLQLSDYKILVNSVGCMKCRPPYMKKLRQKAEELKEHFCVDCKRKISTNPLRIFDCKLEGCQKASEYLPKIKDNLCSDCEKHFLQFCSYLDLYGIEYQIETRLVRGLDYYTKTTFEVVTAKLGAQDAILGGGRYDNMMKEFGGPDVCGIGFAVGLERLLSIIPFETDKENFFYLAYLGAEAKTAAIKLSRHIRKEGFECLIEYRGRSIKNQISRADKLGAKWVLILGEDELKKGVVLLKDMESGLQREISQENIMKVIREIA